MSMNTTEELDDLDSRGMRQTTNGVIDYTPLTWSERILEDDDCHTSKYSGDFFVNQHDANIKIPHGSGHMLWKTSDAVLCKEYTGSWKNGLMDGNGHMKWHHPHPNYSKNYKGEWKNGYIHGYGTMVVRHPYHRNKITLTGQWVRGQMKGQGIMKNEEPDGTWKMYKGTLNEASVDLANDFNRNGRGIMTWSDGRKYDGTWNNDKMNGFGEYTASNGNVYRGVFKDDTFVKYVWPSGSSFDFDLGLLSNKNQRDYVLHEPMLDLNNATGTYTRTDKNGLEKKFKGKWSFFDALELGPQRWQTPNYNDEEENALLGGSKNKSKRRQRQSKRRQRQSKRRQSKRRQRQSKRKYKSKKV